MVPSILALAVMSAAFTGLAIGTGFERKYGVLKRLGATALPRSVLLAGEDPGVLGLEISRSRWSAGSASRWAGTRTATGAGGGAARARHGRLRRPRPAGGRHAAGRGHLGRANLVWLVLLFGGGIAIPLSKFPHGVREVLQYLPSAALSNGLHRVLQGGAELPGRARR